MKDADEQALTRKRLNERLRAAFLADEVGARWHCVRLGTPPDAILPPGRRAQMP